MQQMLCKLISHRPKLLTAIKLAKLLKPFKHADTAN